jgi:hypothetical protein
MAIAIACALSACWWSSLEWQQAHALCHSQQHLRSADDHSAVFPCVEDGVEMDARETGVADGVSSMWGDPDLWLILGSFKGSGRKWLHLF